MNTLVSEHFQLCRGSVKLEDVAFDAMGISGRPVEGGSLNEHYLARRNPKHESESKLPLSRRPRIDIRHRTLSPSVLAH